MPDQFEAFLVTDVNGGRIAEEGQAAITFDNPDGTPLTIALPADKLARLISLSAKLIGNKLPSASGADSAQVIPTHWWSVNPTAAGQVLFGFEPEGGGALIFPLSREAALQLWETLGVVLGVGTVQKPEGKQQ